MNSDVNSIVLHLIEKGSYTQEYINRVQYYMEKNPDLAHEFAYCIPKNVFPDEYIKIKGVTAKFLGSRTLLSRSSIYVALARLREENRLITRIAEEELKHLAEGKKK